MVWLLTETSFWQKPTESSKDFLQFTVMYLQDAATSCKNKQVEDYPYSGIQSIIEKKSFKALSSVLQRMENIQAQILNTTLDNHLHFSFSSQELTALKNRAIKIPLSHYYF